MPKNNLLQNSTNKNTEIAQSQSQSYHFQAIITHRHDLYSGCNFYSSALQQIHWKSPISKAQISIANIYLSFKVKSKNNLLQNSTFKNIEIAQSQSQSYHFQAMITHQHDLYSGCNFYSSALQLIHQKSSISKAQIHI